MKESTLARKIRKILAPLDAMRVENPCLPGTPDIEFIGGWVELKKLDEWPKRATTPVRLPHFTPQQRLWLTRRTEKGGLSLLLLQVSREYLLLYGDQAATLIGQANQAELREAAIEVFNHRTLKSDLLPCFERLISNRTNDS